MIHTYISDVEKYFKEQILTKTAEHLNVVVGNVSGDMDSVVGSVMMGLWLTVKKGFYKAGEKDLSKFYFPLINFPREDMEF